MYDTEKEKYICEICEKNEASIAPKLKVKTRTLFGWLEIVFDKDICQKCFTEKKDEAFRYVVMEIANVVSLGKIPVESAIKQYKKMAGKAHFGLRRLEAIKEMTEKLNA